MNTDQSEVRRRRAHAVKCPSCDARQIIFERIPLIDCCGFQSYTVECKHCGASLVGIIDPADDQLLVTQVKKTDHLE
jgi:ribosomal protein S27E